MNSNTNRISGWIVRIMLIVFVVLTIYPIFFVILTSLKTSSDFYNNIWSLPKTFAWSNYSYAWEVAQIGTYFMTSIIVVGITTAATLMIGSLAGYGLAKLQVPFAGAIVVIIFLLSMLPSESIIMPNYLLINKMGFTGTHASLILPFIGWGLPLTIYIYNNFFLTVPTEVIEAGRIDGCGEVRIFANLVMPMMLPATVTNAIFTFLGWWGEMLWSSVELSASKLKTLPLGLTAFVQSAGTNWGPLCAASAIVLIPVILFFIFTQKYMVAGLTGGAVKG